MVGHAVGEPAVGVGEDLPRAVLFEKVRAPVHEFFEVFEPGFVFFGDLIHITGRGEMRIHFLVSELVIDGFGVFGFGVFPVVDAAFLFP